MAAGPQSDIAPERLRVLQIRLDLTEAYFLWKYPKYKTSVERSNTVVDLGSYANAIASAGIERNSATQGAAARARLGRPLRYRLLAVLRQTCSLPAPLSCRGAVPS